MLENGEVLEQLSIVEQEVEDERNSSMISMLDDLDDDDEPESDDVDLIGLLDDEDDLIGDTDTASERTSIEAVIIRVRRTIEEAMHGDDLMRRAEVTRGF